MSAERVNEEKKGNQNASTEEKGVEQMDVGCEALADSAPTSPSEIVTTQTHFNPNFIGDSLEGLDILHPMHVPEMEM